MPLTYAQFTKELEAKLLSLKEQKNGVQIEGMTLCEKCNIPLQETVTGCRMMHGKHVCSDCYFDALGDEMDEHPIRMPRHAHGGV